MSGSAVRPEHVAALVGTDDDEIIARIIATGATIDEIGAAVVEIENALAFDDAGPASSSPRVASVRAILEPVLARDANVMRGLD